MRTLIGAAMCVAIWVGAPGAAWSQPADDEIVIGVAMASREQPRWSFDVAAMRERADELGVTLRIDWAFDDASEQIWQVDNLIARDVDALIIVSVNDSIARNLVDAGNKAGIPVIAYDIPIPDSEIDYLLTRDNRAAGRLQVDAALAAAPPDETDPPAYVLIKGDSANPVAREIADVYAEVLQPLADAGSIAIVSDGWHANWSTQGAYETALGALTRGDVDAFVVSNDTLALGAARAVEQANPGEPVFISGLDADIANDQLIVRGIIDMTIWTDIETMATEAIDAAVALARAEPPAFDIEIDNGARTVPTALIDVVPVTADTMCTWILEAAPDGWATVEDVYANAEPPPACRTMSEDDGVLTIGLAMSTHLQPRWRFDVDSMRAKAETLGAELVVNWSPSTITDQLWQVDTLISRDVDALIVAATNEGAGRTMVDRANTAGIPVVIYDIPVPAAGIDYFVTRDNRAAGRLQVEAALAAVPADADDPPRYVLVKGDRGNQVARDLADVYDAVLGPLAEAGEIEVVADDWHADWSPLSARQAAELALVRGPVDAFVASNDTLAYGVAGAVAASGEAGDIFISGMDADIPNDQLIVEGTIDMTVWTAIDRMAGEAVEAAVALAGGGMPPSDTTVDYGFGPVPTGLIEVQAVTAENMCAWLMEIAPDGWATVTDVYVRVPPPPECDPG